MLQYSQSLGDCQTKMRDSILSSASTATPDYPLQLLCVSSRRDRMNLLWQGSPNPTTHAAVVEFPPRANVRRRIENCWNMRCDVHPVNSHLIFVIILQPPTACPLLSCICGDLVFIQGAKTGSFFSPQYTNTAICTLHSSWEADDERTFDGVLSEVRILLRKYYLSCSYC
jgi:hypothetical protein